jgi:RHS repeat-associated protein
MEDSNGNYLSITYAAGAGSGQGNTSARITVLADSRAPQWNALTGFTRATWVFTYNGDAIPHLTGIQNVIQTPENYTFTYLTGQPLLSPFDGTSFGTAAFLQSAATTGLGIASAFQYNTSGEMTQMTTPLGGVLQWQYRAFTYGTGIAEREVCYRFAPQYAGVYWWILHNDSVDAGQPYHTDTWVYDSYTTTYKLYVIGTAPSGTFAVPGWYAEMTPGGSATYMSRNWQWTQDTAGNPYIGRMDTFVNPTSPPSPWGSWPSTSTYQIIDTYGNLAQQQVSDYGAASSPTWTYNFSYLHQSNGNYAPLYIRNRLTQATVTSSAGTVTLVGKTYDGYSSSWPYYAMQASNSPPMHDGSYSTSFPYRGNPTMVVAMGSNSGIGYQDTGVPYQYVDGAGRTVSTSPSSSANYALPGVLTPGGNGNLATTVSYASSWAVTQVVSANGATSTTAYDSFGRPQSSTSTDGAVTSYTYTYNPNIQTATVNNRWVKTTLDGFGRTIQVDTGTGSTTVSVAETQYAPCACSPLGKLYRTSRPHAPGAQPIWTTYAYDGSGRTVSVTLPDGSVNTTSYAANQTTVTDAAGKWKTYTKDAQGNLAAVTEPNPAGGANLATSYTYNAANQLIGVSMPRPYNGNTYNQTRTFTWSGTDLASETTPEAGTVSYQYDGAHRVTQRTDAKGQQTQYSYDAYGRLITVRRFAMVQNCGVLGCSPPYLQEQTNQRVDHYYDANPFDSSGFSQNVWGRLAATAFHNEQPNSAESFNYQYSYNTAGRAVRQRLFMQPATNPNYAATSTSTATIANNGSVAFATQSNLFYVPGVRVRAVAGPGIYMEGICTSYDGYTLTIAMDTAVGFGTYSSWTLNVPENLNAVTLEADYAWDNEGRMTSLQYPSQDAMHPYTYQYDSMGRFSQEQGYPTWWNNSYPLTVASATWNPDGTMATVDGQTRTYNNLGQMIRMTGSGTIDMQYIYPAGQNNGRISQTTDGVTGETVNYTYDALNRLATAQATSGAWGNAYSYDGWGNLTGKAVTAGTAPTYSANPDPSRNGGPDPTAPDPSLDVENRNIGTPGYYGGPSWTYDSTGKMVFYENNSGVQNGTPPTCELRFFSITGQRMETYTCGYTVDQYGLQSFAWSFKEREHKTAGVLTDWGGLSVTTDRLGSIRTDGHGGRYSYYPYGEVRSAPTGQTGMFGDLEDPIRGYDSNAARFTVPDPLGMNAANKMDPGSWNRFVYAQGDPINFIDPRGTNRLMCDVYTDYGCAGSPSFDPSGGYFVNWYWGEGGWYPGGVVYFRSPGGPTDPIGGGLGDSSPGLSVKCQNALSADRKDAAAVDRALASKDALKAAADAYGLDWAVLAAIGVRETGFQNVNSANGMYGVFQINIAANGVSAQDADDIAIAAGIAAGILAGAERRFGKAASAAGVDPLLPALGFYDGESSRTVRHALASKNPLGALDRASDGHNYVSNVLDLVDCFK